MRVYSGFTLSNSNKLYIGYVGDQSSLHNQPILPQITILEIKDSNISLTTFFTLLYKLPNLSTLEINKAPNLFGVNVTDFYLELDRLKSIKIYNSPLSGISLAILLRASRNLVTLCIKDCIRLQDLDVASLPEFAQLDEITIYGRTNLPALFISKAVNLRSLNLSSCNNLSMMNIDSFPNLRTLQKLRYYNSDMPQVTLAAILLGTELQKIDLMIDEGYGNLPDLINGQQLPVLAELEFHVTRNNVGLYSALINSAPNLILVATRFNDYGPTEADISVLNSNPSVKQLYFLNMGDDVQINILPIIAKTPNLEDLSVVRISLMPEHNYFLALPNLKFLWLKWDRAADVAGLLMLLNRASNLECLHIEWPIRGANNNGFGDNHLLISITEHGFTFPPLPSLSSIMAENIFDIASQLKLLKAAPRLLKDVKFLYDCVMGLEVTHPAFCSLSRQLFIAARDDKNYVFEPQELEDLKGLVLRQPTPRHVLMLIKSMHDDLKETMLFDQEIFSILVDNNLLQAKFKTKRVKKLSALSQVKGIQPVFNKILSFIGSELCYKLASTMPESAAAAQAEPRAESEQKNNKRLRLG